MEFRADGATFKALLLFVEPAACNGIQAEHFSKFNIWPNQSQEYFRHFDAL